MILINFLLEWDEILEIEVVQNKEKSADSSCSYSSFDCYYFTKFIIKIKRNISLISSHLAVYKSIEVFMVTFESLTEIR
jgi:hypothetical protein